MSFPDVCALLIGYLEPVVTPVEVRTRVPDPVPDTWVQVRRVGGTRVWPVRDTPRVDTMCWAPTEAEAHDLCMTVRTALWALKGTNTLGLACYDVDEFLGPRAIDDPLTGSPRYWMTHSFSLRAE